MKIKNLSENLYYKIVLLIGFICSVLWVIFINSIPFSDFDYYYNLAVDIANGLPWGDTYTSVGYCIVLGGIFKLFGASVLKAKIFNILLTFISNICFISILNKIDIKEKNKKIIFALFVFMPNNIFYNSILGTEILFTTILLIITNIYFGKSKFKYLWIGILTGLNTMIKPFFIMFFFAIFLVDIIKNRKFTKSFLNSIVVLIITALIIAPWLYRNTKLVGQFTYVSNNGGIVLYINNNSQNNVGRWMAAADVENSIVKTDQYKKANMTQKNKMLSNAAKKWIRNHPGKFVELGVKRLYNTYFVSDDLLYSMYGSGLNNYTSEKLVNFVSNIRIIVFTLGIVYILIYSIFILKKIFLKETYLLNKFKLYSVVLFFMFTCVYFITEGQGRYAFPEIFIMIYAFFNLIIDIIYKFKGLQL